MDEGVDRMTGDWRDQRKWKRKGSGGKWSEGMKE